MPLQSPQIDISEHMEHFTLPIVPECSKRHAELGSGAPQSRDAAVQGLHKTLRLNAPQMASIEFIVQGKSDRLVAEPMKN
jgi:hypothetical protein